MPRTAHFHVSGLLREVALFTTRLRAAGADPEDDAGDCASEDEELALFADRDADRGHGLGFFVTDDEENRSRWLDMRGPYDYDSGPIEMEEAHGSGGAVVLQFE